MNRIYLLIISLLVALPTQAQDFWEEINLPEVDDLYVNSCLAVDNDEIFLGTSHSSYGGLIATYNGGITWNSVDLTPYNSFGGCIQKNNSLIYIYVDGSLFRKDLSSDIWQNLGNNQRAGKMISINDTIFFKGLWGDIEKTIDGGATWETNFSTYLNENVEDIIQHPNGDLFFGTYCTEELSSPGVYKSSDTGETWNHIGLENYYVGSLATDSHGNIYAGIIGHHTTAEGGLFKSQDLGGTWEKIFNEGYVNSIVITKEDSIFLGTNNGVYRSENGGNTWIRIIDGLSYPAVSNLSIGGDGHIYAIIADNDDRLFRSINPITGIQKTNTYPAEAFTLYPNPVKSILNVESLDYSRSAWITISNAVGQIILSDVYTLPTQIDVSALLSGIYFVTISNKKKIKTFRIIKKEQPNY